MVNKEKKFSRKIRAISLTQIFLLVISVVAFSYLVGESLPVVSGQDDDSEPEFRQGQSQTQKSTISASNIPTYISGGIKLFEIGEKVLGGGAEVAATEFSAFAAANLGKEVTINGITGILSQEGTKYFITDAAGVVSEVAPAGILGTEINLGALLTNAGYAAAIYAVVSFGLQLFGVDPSLANKIGGSAAIGYFAGWLAAQKGIGVASWVANGLGISLGLATFGIGLVVGFIAFVLFGGFTKHDERSIHFTCNLWDAPSGGRNCEKCNDGVLPCSEYRCRSLGQSCGLVNKGTKQELCVWVNRDDLAYPIIQPWNEALTTNYKYIPDNAISPPDRGVKIVPKDNANGCIVPFTRLTFGVALNEPAKCKISPVRANTFDEMENRFFSGGLKSYNHSYQLSQPSSGALAAENVTIPTGEDLSLYVKCQDENGNSNVANFVFKFCVDEIDTSEPQIMGTSILNGMPIAFNKTSVNLSVYVNEPAECKWSKTDLGYDDMENSMSCKTGVFQMNTQGLYECQTVLTGLKDRVDNYFYFKCKDQPHLGPDNPDRFTNQQSYKFTLKGTEPLYISSAKPNETTMKDSTDVIKVGLEVETSAGYDKGKSMCSYNGYGTNGNFVEFYVTNSYKHSQNLFLPKGNYTYNIRCVDFGGNADTTQVNFNVETDTQPPVIARVYKDANNLKVITNEGGSSCVYNDKVEIGCEYDFDDGINMSKDADGKVHSTSWDKNKIFYIKCQDDFGNRPLPNQCNMVAKPFDIG